MAVLSPYESPSTYPAASTSKDSPEARPSSPTGGPHGAAAHDGHGVNTRGTCPRDTLDLADGPGRAETRLRLPWRDQGTVRDRVSSSTSSHISQSSFSHHSTPPRCFRRHRLIRLLHHQIHRHLRETCLRTPPQTLNRRNPLHM
jgi:hypothetical protein